MIYFIHIPKTGGTSLHSILDESPLDVSPMIKRRHIKQWKSEGRFKEELQAHNLAFGHFTYAEISDFITSGDKVITWVRDPADRVFSNYHFFMAGLSKPERNPEQYSINQHRKGETLREYAEKEENRDRMSKFLEGINHKDLDFIGRLENMDEDIQRLGSFLGVGLDQPPFLNKGQGGARGMTDEERAMLVSLNREDVRLYEEINEKIRYGLV